MSTQQPTHLTLAHTIWPSLSDANGWLRGLALAFIGSLVIAVSAKIQVPFYPVPMTMQTFAILTIAMAFGPKLGVATIALYLGQGALGLPVFAGTPEKGIGIAYMMGPTGGYLFGYLFAAAFVGWLAARGWDRSILKTLTAMVGGTAIIFIPGLLWLGVLFGWDKPILEWGLTPFLPGAVFKIALATAVLPMAWKLLRR